MDKHIRSSQMRTISILSNQIIKIFILEFQEKKLNSFFYSVKGIELSGHQSSQYTNYIYIYIYKNFDS